MGPRFNIRQNQEVRWQSGCGLQIPGDSSRSGVDIVNLVTGFIYNKKIHVSWWLLGARRRAKYEALHDADL